MTATTSVALKGRFTYNRSAEVAYGPGSLNELPGLVSRLGGSRVFAIASASLAADGLEDRLAELLGDRYAGLHSGVAQHVPRASVLAAAEAAAEAGSDVLLSVGGGTPIDCTKAVALCLAESIADRARFDEYHIRFTYPDQIHRPSLPNAPLPHVSVPTTLSGSEHTNLFGVTDEERHVKDLFTGPAFVPRAVVLDGELATATPGDLWGASGVRAIDHAVEGTLSRRHVPFMDALALESLRILRRRLVESVRDPQDIGARSDCLLGAWLAVYGLTNVGAGLSHAIGHQLAAAFDIMHGVTSAIVLPHVLRFNAPVIRDRIARLAEPLGASGEGKDGTMTDRVIDAIAALIGELEPFGVPHRLRDAGATRPELAAVADRVLHDMAAAVNPRPVSHADLMAVLGAAW